MRSRIGLWAGVCLGVLLLGGLSLPVSDRVVQRAAEGSLFDDVSQVPHRKVGLLLGTSKFVGERINLFYQYRLDAAVELYQSQKIDYVLVTGDNSTVQYDEPTTMRNDLVQRGIPEDHIVLDYAGFRTLDSVVRANRVFGQEAFTVISQKFHNERAVYLARAHGLDAIGFNAQDVGGYGGMRVLLREQFARLAAILDVKVLNTQPKFLGEPIQIGKR
ncbi:SanA/YdcF family protein [Deinococcus cellulosilyticus]|uniref:SanA/YdcF family protein n=1 Tax=Deinococcus cellulosilyticus TaxID=401558 RepID=UPI0011BED65C|nr:ElyC/SanA/YdcF family protein [Deinococcus cellulosilyticus]